MARRDGAQCARKLLNWHSSCLSLGQGTRGGNMLQPPPSPTTTTTQPLTTLLFPSAPTRFTYTPVVQTHNCAPGGRGSLGGRGSFGCSTPVSTAGMVGLITAWGRMIILSTSPYSCSYPLTVWQFVWSDSQQNHTRPQEATQTQLGAGQSNTHQRVATFSAHGCPPRCTCNPHESICKAAERDRKERVGSAAKLS
jgi:hypothetical protein